MFFLSCIFRYCIYYYICIYIDIHPSPTTNPAFLSIFLFKLYTTSHKWSQTYDLDFSGMVWRTYLSIKSFQTKPDQAQKSATNDLLNKKTAHSKRRNTHASPHRSAIFLLPFCFCPFPLILLHFTPDIQWPADDHPISRSPLHIAPGGPKRGPIKVVGDSLRGWTVSGDLCEVDGVLSDGQKRAVLRGGRQAVDGHGFF